MRKVILSAVLWILILGMLPPARTASAASATMTILDTLGSVYSEALAINDNGQIVGSSFVGSSTSIHHAVVWNNGVPTDLGTLGGALSVANDINNAGQIVGFSTLAGDTQSHAVLWDNGAINDLGCLPGGSHCEARSINNHGQIVGFSETAGSSYHATLWANGTIRDLDAGTGGGSRAFTNNDRGQIGGSSQLRLGTAVATFWNHGQQPIVLRHANLAAIFDMNNRDQALTARYGEDHDSYYLLGRGRRVDLTYVNGTYFFPTALNDRGQVAGYMPSPPGEAVVVWQHGAIIDLGPLPGPYFSGNPNDLNNHGQVVGTISTAEGARAVVWTML